MPENRITISSQEELRHAQRISQLNQEFRKRYEVGIIGEVLDSSQEGLTFKDLLSKVQALVEADRADGLKPPFNMKPVLVVAALSILQDLDAVEQLAEPKRWSLTPIGREVVVELPQCQPVAIGR